jgi:hypothetical protein
MINGMIFKADLFCGELTKQVREQVGDYLVEPDSDD